MISTSSPSRNRAKIGIVTGGSRGLGRNTVLNLAIRGVDTIFTYHTNRGQADAVRDAVRAAGHTAIALQLNVKDVASYHTFVQSVRDALEGLGAERFDYLVNNAGTGLHKSFEDTTEADLDEMYTLHLKAPFLLTQRLLPL